MKIIVSSILFTLAVTGCGVNSNKHPSSLLDEVNAKFRYLGEFTYIQEDSGSIEGSYFAYADFRAGGVCRKRVLHVRPSGRRGELDLKYVVNYFSVDDDAKCPENIDNYATSRNVYLPNYLIRNIYSDLEKLDRSIIKNKDYVLKSIQVIDHEVPGNALLEVRLKFPAGSNKTLLIDYSEKEIHLVHSWDSTATE